MRLIFLFFLLLPMLANTQVSKDSAAVVIKNMYRQSYSEQKAYKWLTTLTKDIGHRVSGSEAAAKAVAWGKSVLDTIGLDSVWLQEVRVPHWVRGDKENVILISKEVGAVSLRALALGNSPGTGNEGVRAGVIEVKSLDQLKAMPNESVKGKIVFFNRPMDPGLSNMMASYGGAGDQRNTGPALAAEKGAVAAIVRSLCPRLDDFPHTGATHLSETVKNIPSVAISTNDAEVLSKAVALGTAEVYIRTMCQMYEDVTSYNVIGEIKGTVSPDTVLMVGGHLDSWDVGEGANDDGAGVVQSMESLYRLAHSGYKPKHTIRCVLFMNEENGLRGGKKYAEEAIAKKEYHLISLETDSGAGTPQSFGCTMGSDSLPDKHIAYLKPYMDVFDPYYVRVESGGGGADIRDMTKISGLLVGLKTDNSRYFDYHHSDNDVLENVDPRELESGAAAIASFMYLIDQYGIGK